jgi:hypothetical protein
MSALTNERFQRPFPDSIREFERAEERHPEAAARIREETAAPPKETAAPATQATEPPSTSTNTVNRNGNPSSPFEHSGHAALLRDTTNMLVDVLVQPQRRAVRPASRKLESGSPGDHHRDAVHHPAAYPLPESCQGICGPECCTGRGIWEWREGDDGSF